MSSFSIPHGNAYREDGHLPLRDRTVKIKQEENQSSRSRAFQPHQPPEPSSNGNSLQFINLLGTEKHDTEGKNTVRSHARRHAWRNQRRGQDKQEASPSSNPSQPTSPRKADYRSLQASKPPVKNSQAYFDQCSKFRDVARLLPQRSYSFPPSKGEDHGRFRNLPPELARVAETASERTNQPQVNHPGITNGHADPFNAFPIPLTPRLHHLIHYSRGVQNLAHEDTQDGFSSHMGRSPSLIYATLAWTTALTATSRQPRSSESEYFLHMSITAINDDLSKVHQQGLSDGTVAAVACLSNMENLNGDKTKAQIHMNGLQQMIVTRGGMKSLGMSGILRRLVLWADVLSATRWETTPRFPLSELPDLLNLPPLASFRPPATPKPYFEVINVSFIDLINNTGTQLLFHIMRETYELAHFLDNTPPKDPGLLERASFPDRIYLVEHQLLQLIAQNEARQHRELGDSLLPPLLHSLLLYIYTNIRLTPVDGQIRLTLISRLQKYLQQSEIVGLNRLFPHELRWMHFLGGGAASKGTPERAWFVHSLVDCGCRREWALFEHIVLGLKGFEAAFLTRCEDYWREVDELRRVDGHLEGRHGPLCVSDRDASAVDEVMGDYI